MLTDEDTPTIRTIIKRRPIIRRRDIALIWFGNNKVLLLVMFIIFSTPALAWIMVLTFPKRTAWSLLSMLPSMIATAWLLWGIDRGKKTKRQMWGH